MRLHVIDALYFRALSINAFGITLSVPLRVRRIESQSIAQIAAAFCTFIPRHNNAAGQVWAQSFFSVPYACSLTFFFGRRRRDDRARIRRHDQFTTPRSL